MGRLFFLVREGLWSASLELLNSILENSAVILEDEELLLEND